MSALRHVRGHPCGSGPAGVLLQYAEEPKGHPLAGRGAPARAGRAVGAARWMIAALQ